MSYYEYNFLLKLLELTKSEDCCVDTYYSLMDYIYGINGYNHSTESVSVDTFNTKYEFSQFIIVCIDSIFKCLWIMWNYN